MYNLRYNNKGLQYLSLQHCATLRVVLPTDDALYSLKELFSNSVVM